MIALSRRINLVCFIFYVGIVVSLETFEAVYTALVDQHRHLHRVLLS